MDIERAINIAIGCVVASSMDSETKQMVIESLSQMAIPKKETTTCEWCEIARMTDLRQSEAYYLNFARTVADDWRVDYGK